MIAFIDSHRDQFGVEFICRTLRAVITGFLTSRGYRAARTRPASDRAIRDELLVAELKTVHHRNYSCYGVNKMQVAMKRRGWRIGREQTRRLMRKAGLRGVQRGKPVFTTICDPSATTPPHLVNRRFAAMLPNQLWVADITYVRTWQGFLLHRFRQRRLHQGDRGLGVCADDRLVDPRWSKRIASDRLGAHLVELPGSHSPLLSRPQALADVLCRVAESYVEKNVVGLDISG